MRLHRACRVIVPALLVLDLVLGWQLVRAWSERSDARAGLPTPTTGADAAAAPAAVRS